MALPTRPLAIKDACTSTRSIAREVDGNVTGNKTLETLGDSAFGAGSHAMSDFEGYSSGIDASVCTYTTVGSNFSCCSCKYGCVIYSAAFAAGQTWCACFSWVMEATRETSGTACACFYVSCNGVNKANCYITRSFNGSTVCDGSVSVGPIDSNDVVRMIVFTRGSYGGGGGYAYANSCIYMSCSFANVNGGVNLVFPQYISVYAVASY